MADLHEARRILRLEHFQRLAGNLAMSSHYANHVDTALAYAEADAVMEWRQKILVYLRYSVVSGYYGQTSSVND